MIKAMECFGEIMNDSHINIPEGGRKLINWKAGRMIRLIILDEDLASEDMLKKLQKKELIRIPTKKNVKPLDKRRFVQVKGEQMSETVIKLRGEK